jgi:glycosyltransferase involved in cell wall biosynthesis
MQTPKNILYIAPYRQNDGWGLASKDCLLSLLTTPHTVSSVPVYLNHSARCDITDKNILRSEQINCDNYDIVIQVALPMSLSYNRDCGKNIGMIFLENNKLFSDSIMALNSLDQILVSSAKEIKCLKDSGVKTQINSIMQPINTSAIASFSQKNLKLQFNGKNTNSYKFYYIGEHIQRKNIKDMMSAFYLEFDETEDVCFMLKTNIPGMSAQQSAAQIQQELLDIQKSLRTKKRFPQVVTVTERLSEDQIFSIHQACDCFVVASLGEAFCRPAAEALCFGNYTIMSKNIGIQEMIDLTDCSVVSTQEQPVIVKDNTYLGGLDMYNGEETWSVPSILDLRTQMRKAFEERPKVDSEKYLPRFSYESIGQNICHCIQ